MSARLSLENVERVFGGVRAVDGASFEVREGEVHGLIGPNGAGKTTIINLVSGVLQPSSGAIHVEGRPTRGLAPHRIAALGIARTFQNIRLFPDLSARDNVIVGEHLRRKESLPARLLGLPPAREAERIARERAEALLERVGLAERRREKVKNLSYGEQRRVEIARALASDPKLLLLDEPTAGMSDQETFNIAQLVRRLHRDRKLTVVLIEHDMRVIFHLADRITVLAEGATLADGTPDEIAHDESVQTAYLGVAAR